MIGTTEIMNNGSNLLGKEKDPDQNHLKWSESREHNYW